MQTILVCGGTREERLVKAYEKIKDVSREDLIMVDCQTAGGIETVRQLKHQLSLKPYRSPFKACLLQNADLLTIPAQNALLKTLEEPPPRTLLLLTAPSSEALLPTIVSRSQIIQLAAKGEINLTEEELQDSLSTVTWEFSPDFGERLKLAEKIASNREETLDFLGKQTFLWRQILLEKFQALPEKRIAKSLGKKLDKIGVPANRLGGGQIVDVLRRLQKTRRMIEGNVSHKLALEIFLFDFPALSEINHE